MPRVTTGESLISRAVRIFEVFSSSRPALTVTEISRASGLHVSTTSRLVAELVAHGLLARTETGEVAIGIRLWELAQRASPALPLREAAMPYLEDLHAVVGHHVQLGVLDGRDVLFLERLSAPGGVVNLTEIAGRLPLHASSSGLVLLAFAPAQLQDEVLAAPLRRFTPDTVTDPARVRDRLAAIRRDGYVVTPGYIDLRATGTAVPVFRGRTVVAAVSAVVPNDGKAFTVVPVLQAAARGIARGLRGPEKPSQ